MCNHKSGLAIPLCPNDEMEEAESGTTVLECTKNLPRFILIMFSSVAAWRRHSSTRA
jgi:hypothetical protein